LLILPAPDVAKVFVIVFGDADEQIHPFPYDLSIGFVEFLGQPQAFEVIHLVAGDAVIEDVVLEKELGVSLLDDLMEGQEFLYETTDDVVDGDLILDEDSYDDKVALVGKLLDELVHEADQLVAEFVHEFELEFFLVHFV
jgi:hypothetical protein